MADAFTFTEEQFLQETVGEELTELFNSPNAISRKVFLPIYRRLSSLRDAAGMVSTRRLVENLACMIGIEPDDFTELMAACRLIPNLQVPFPYHITTEALEEYGLQPFEEVTAKILRMVVKTGNITTLPVRDSTTNEPRIMTLLAHQKAHVFRSGIRRWTNRQYDLYKTTADYFENGFAATSHLYYEKLIQTCGKEAAKDPAAARALVFGLPLPEGELHTIWNMIRGVVVPPGTHIGHALPIWMRIVSGTTHVKWMLHAFFDAAELLLFRTPRPQNVTTAGTALSFRFPVSVIDAPGSAYVRPVCTKEEEATIVNEYYVTGPGEDDPKYEATAMWWVRHVLRYQGVFPLPPTTSFGMSVPPMLVTSANCKVAAILRSHTQLTAAGYNIKDNWITPPEGFSYFSLSRHLLLARWALRYLGFTKNNNRPMNHDDADLPAHLDGSDVRLMARLADFPLAVLRGYANVVDGSEELTAWVANDPLVVPFMRDQYELWLTGQAPHLDLIACKALVYLRGFEALRQQQFSVMMGISPTLRSGRMVVRPDAGRIGRFMRIFSKVSYDMAHELTVLHIGIPGAIPAVARRGETFMLDAFDRWANQEAHSHWDLVKNGDPL